MDPTNVYTIDSRINKTNFYLSAQVETRSIFNNRFKYKREQYLSVDQAWTWSLSIDWNINTMFINSSIYKSNVYILKDKGNAYL